MNAVDKKQLIITIVLVLALAGWYVLIFRNMQSDVGAIRKRMGVLEEEIKKDIPEVRIAAIQRQTDSLKTVIGEKQKKLFHENDFQTIGKRMTQTVNGFGLQTTAVTPDFGNLNTIRVKQGEISEVTIGLQAKGTFPEFTKFIDAFPALPFALKINQFQLNKEEDPKTGLQFNLKGAVMFTQDTVAQERAQKTAEKK
jgi:Tfp pilus assembly protein PilO